jgi:hypothetical protein
VNARLPGEEPDSADIRGEEGSQVTWAKTFVWLTLAAPGFWLAFQVPQRGDFGDGYLQFGIMGLSLVVAAVVTEIAWHSIGHGGRGFLRAWAFLLPFALGGAFLLLQAMARSDVTIDTPTLPFERFGWWLLLAVVATIASWSVASRVAEWLGPAVLRKGAFLLLAGAVVSLGAWYAHARVSRPTAGIEWRILTNPLALPRRATLAEATRGCAALGAGWRLASRIELETREYVLRRHGSVRFWVGPGPVVPTEPATSYAPGEAGGRFAVAPPAESLLALCMLEAAAGK